MRAIVTYRGAVVLELTGDELDEETIVRAALGENSQHTSAAAH